MLNVVSLKCFTMFQVSMCLNISGQDLGWANSMLFCHPEYPSSHPGYMSHTPLSSQISGPASYVCSLLTRHPGDIGTLFSETYNNHGINKYKRKLVIKFWRHFCFLIQKCTKCLITELSMSRKKYGNPAFLLILGLVPHFPHCLRMSRISVNVFTLQSSSHLFYLYFVAYFAIHLNITFEHIVL